MQRGSFSDQSPRSLRRSQPDPPAPPAALAKPRHRPTRPPKPNGEGEAPHAGCPWRLAFEDAQYTVRTVTACLCTSEPPTGLSCARSCGVMLTWVKNCCCSACCLREPPV